MAASQTTNQYGEGKALKIESPLATGTLNVRGLREINKQIAIINCLKREKLDIVSLQETHLAEKQT